MARHTAHGDRLMRKTTSALAILALALAACAPKVDLDAARTSPGGSLREWLHQIVPALKTQLSCGPG